jgi:hypothetical protein
MRLVQHGRIQYITCARPDEVHLQVVCILEGDFRIAKIIRIRENVSRGVAANSRQTLNITRSTRNNVHGSLRIFKSGRIRDRVVDWKEALRVVDVAKDRKINTVLVEQWFKCLLASGATTATCRVPRTMSANDDPRGDGTVDRS